VFGRYLLVGFLPGSGFAAVAWRGPVAIIQDDLALDFTATALTQRCCHGVTESIMELWGRSWSYGETNAANRVTNPMIDPASAPFRRRVTCAGGGDTDFGPEWAARQRRQGLIRRLFRTVG
jgi:hypothetical protein